MIYDRIQQESSYEEFLDVIYFISFFKYGVYVEEIQSQFGEDFNLKLWKKISTLKEQEEKLNTVIIET